MRRRHFYAQEYHANWTTVYAFLWKSKRDEFVKSGRCNKRMALTRQQALRCGKTAIYGGEAISIKGERDVY